MEFTSMHEFLRSTELFTHFDLGETRTWRDDDIIPAHTIRGVSWMQYCCDHFNDSRCELLRHLFILYPNKKILFDMSIGYDKHIPFVAVRAVSASMVSENAELN